MSITIVILLFFLQACRLVMLVHIRDVAVEIVANMDDE